MATKNTIQISRHCSLQCLEKSVEGCYTICTWEVLWALREEVLANPNQYDILKLFEKPMLAVEAAALEKYKLLNW
ncbi:MAG: hypothetical protein ACRCUS_04040 [Anaerovoracaceae bacterium]